MLTQYGHANEGLTLVCDGSLFPPGAALVRDAEVVVFAEQEGSRASRGGLFSLVETLLREQGAKPGDLSRIVVGTGPGSFTGVRVALGLARGLALARPDVPVEGIDAPRILARAAERALPVRVAIPWGRLRVLVTRARAEGPLPEESRLLPRHQLAGMSELAGEEIVCPASLTSEAWPEGTRVVPTEGAPVLGLARLVADGFQPTGEAFPEPVYLVAPDAVLPVREGRLPEGFAMFEFGPGDLESVAEVERQAFDTPWSAAMLREELEARPERVAVGVRDEEGVLVAYAFARHAPDALWILNVATRPSGRRKGVARALVRELLSRAREADHPRVELEVRVTNDAAIALYASEGFVPVGRRPRYYRDGTDALLMTSVLRR